MRLTRKLSIPLQPKKIFNKMMSLQAGKCTVYQNIMTSFLQSPHVFRKNLLGYLHAITITLRHNV
jgi:hypothetical protein